MDDWRRLHGNPKELDAFGAAVRQWRLGHGMSQRQLARQARMSQASVSRLERGLTPGIRLWRIARLLSLMGVARPRPETVAA